VTVDEVLAAIRRLPDKSSSADPLTVPVLKQLSAELVPYLTELFNRSMDLGHFAVLVLLDLSAAFDTVDHAILVRRLELSFGITGPALEWFRSYLTDRSQHVRRGTDKSPITSLTCGVPHGSVLGPVLFLLYTAELQDIVTRHALRPHVYADDTKI
jgi:hypothetical protein